MEAKVIASNTFGQRFGAIGGFLIGMVAIAGGLVSGTRKSVEGFSAFFLALASLVGVYVYGKQSQINERKRKDSDK